MDFLKNKYIYLYKYLVYIFLYKNCLYLLEKKFLFILFIYILINLKNHYTNFTIIYFFFIHNDSIYEITNNNKIYN